MPNLVPPLTQARDILAYKKRLQSIEPNVEFLMSLYLTSSTTIETIKEAKRAGITGVKSVSFLLAISQSRGKPILRTNDPSTRLDPPSHSPFRINTDSRTTKYPAGLTTNSSGGILGTDYSPLFPVFTQMEKEDMVLNLRKRLFHVKFHLFRNPELPSVLYRIEQMILMEGPISDGECPSTGDVTIMSAEHAFLPILRDLHKRFPSLRIILEHLSTAAAVEAVEMCGKNVAGTITAHHLSLIVDDWQGDPHCNWLVVASSSSLLFVAPRLQFRKGARHVWKKAVILRILDL